MDQIWWEHIIKPNLFIKNITNTLFEGNSVALFLPEHVPWYDTMVTLIQDKLRLENSNNSFVDFNSPDGEVGLLLLEKFCSKEKRVTYRPSKSYAEFLGQSTDIVLNDHYIWVRGLNELTYRKWVVFVQEYNQYVPKSKTPGLFIIEAPFQMQDDEARKGIKKLSFENTITQFDIYTFCMLITSDIKCHDALKPYLADVVAHLCMNDIELCSQCIQRGEFFLKEPIDTLHSIIDNEFHDDESAFDFTCKDHRIETYLWESQIRFLFPAIENYRSSLVKKYSNQLEKLLPMENFHNERIETPQDVELSLFNGLIMQKEIRIEKEDKVQLDRFRIARNYLAHRRSLKLDDIKYILCHQKI